MQINIFKFLNPLINIYPNFEITVYKLLYKLDFIIFDLNEAQYPNSITSFKNELESQLDNTYLNDYTCTILLKISKQGKFEKVTWSESSMGFDQNKFISIVSNFKFKDFKPSSVLGIIITSYIKIEVINNKIKSLQIILCPYKHTFFTSKRKPFILE